MRTALESDKKILARAATQLSLAIQNYESLCLIVKPGEVGKLRLANLRFLKDQLETHGMAAIAAIGHFYLKQKGSSRLCLCLRSALLAIHAIREPARHYSMYGHGLAEIQKDIQLNAIIEKIATIHKPAVNELLTDAMSAAICSVSANTLDNQAITYGCEIELPHYRVRL